MKITSWGYATAVAVGRVAIGIIFFWAGLEKVTQGDGKGGFYDAAGFLKNATGGTLGWPFVSGTPNPDTVYNPTHDFWVSLAGSGIMPAVNGLVVAGEFLIGAALILGLFTRFAAGMGTLMMLLFFFAAWDFAYGIVNQHLAYAVVTFGLGVIGAGNYFGLDALLADRVPGGVRRWLLSGDPDNAWRTASA